MQVSISAPEDRLNERLVSGSSDMIFNGRDWVVTFVAGHATRL